jgi:hypothetical protein
MNKFNPNAATFEDGVRRIQKAIDKVGAKVGKNIFTSRDKEAIALVNLLAVDTTPDGFKKWQLPFSFDRAQFFLSVGNPDVKVPEHSHDEGDGIRFIVSGSVYYNDRELTGGDWMYIPKEAKYSFTVGPFGATMCYCYACCCAGIELNQSDWVINPASFR